MAGNPLAGLRISKGGILWLCLSVLLLLGILTTVIDLTGLGVRETKRANADGQRAIIDPRTGNVALGGAQQKSQKSEAQFDVATEVPSAAAPTTAHTEHATEPAPALALTESENHQAPAHAEAPVMPTPTAAPYPADQPAGLSSLQTTPVAHGLPASTRTAQSLVAAPAREISETVDGLTLPKKGDKGILPATLYARPFTRKEGAHLLTFVITDVGLNQASLPLLMSLPREVTLAMSPYTRNSAAMIETLRNAGFEVWTSLPMMSTRYPQDDPGPLGLIGSMPVEETLRRLREMMAALPGSVGFVFPPDEALSAKREVFTPVMKAIEARGLYMLSTHPTRSLGQLTKEAALEPVLRRADTWLDPTPDSAQIQSKLSGITNTVAAQPNLVILTSARPQTLEMLRDWFAQNPLAEPAVLAPLSGQFKEVAAEPPPAAEEKPAGGHGGGH